MSVSDPLLKRLKGFIIALRSADEDVKDSHKLLEPLCDTLEQIYEKGLKVGTSWFTKKHYWTWIARLPVGLKQERISPLLSIAINNVKKSKKVQTDLGRGRVFLRTALVKKVLITPIQILADNPHFAAAWYSIYESILANEILNEILRSLLHELKEVTFDLQLHNVSFLDATWELPLYRMYEFVPSDDLGLDIKTIKGYPLVTQVDSNSVAAEDGKIAVGDVLDEMCGESLRGVGKSGVYYIFHQHEGKPIHIGVVKCQRKNGTTFGPISRLLQMADLGDVSPSPETSPSEDCPWSPGDDKTPPEAILPEHIDDEVPVHDSEARATYETVYLGKAFLGKDGRVKMIEAGVGEILCRSKTRQDVILEMGEKDLVVSDKCSREVIVRHVYTEISACGRRTDALRNFSFIAGETYCSLAEDFYCYVFEATCEEQAKVILCTIAQGFERTHLMA